MEFADEVLGFKAFRVQGCSIWRPGLGFDIF